MGPSGNPYYMQTIDVSVCTYNKLKNNNVIYIVYLLCINTYKNIWSVHIEHISTRKICFPDLKLNKIPVSATLFLPSPLVSNPEDAMLPERTRQLLTRLAGRSDVFLAIISGRGLPALTEKVDIQGITYAGNHGLDILHADLSTVSQSCRNPGEL